MDYFLSVSEEVVIQKNKNFFFCLAFADIDSAMNADVKLYINVNSM